MLPEQHLPDSMALLWSLLEDDTPVRFGIAAFTVFSLRENTSSPVEAGDSLVSAAELWPVFARGLGPQGTLDKGFPKPEAEYLVYGSCHAPQPVQASQVRVEVGPLSKTLSVYGPRRWGSMGIERYGTFTQIPVNYAHAFGGPEYAPNPLGMGHPSTGNNLLPHVELPGNLIGLRSDTPPPAGFNVVRAHWPQRAKYLGKFDKKWQTERWPHLPQDTDPTYFHSAPKDQHLPGFYTGDEKVRIENMHPERPVIESELPGLRGRLFLARRGFFTEDEAGEKDKGFEEIPLQLDTLWLFPGEERGVLLYRGTFSSVDDELGDIEHFYGAWEPLGDTPLPAEQYREQLRRKLAQEAREAAREAAVKPLPEPGAGEAGPAGPPPPEESAPDAAPLTGGAALVAGAAQVGGPLSPAPAMAAELESPELSALRESLDELDALVKETAAKSGVNAQEFQAELEKGLQEEALENETTQLEDTKAFLASLGRDPEQAATMNETQQMELALEQLDGEIQRLARENGMELPSLDALVEEETQPLLPEETEVGEDLARLAQDVNQLKVQGLDTGDFEEALNELRGIQAEFTKLALPVAGTALAPGDGEDDAAPPADDEAEQALAPLAPRERAETLLAAGKGLARLDLSEADLSGMDFRGCDLSHANLRGANLENCILAKAVLDSADLSEARLSGADLSGASLRKASLLRASGENIIAREADCILADFTSAHFVTADFGKACFANAILAEATLEQCDMQECVFTKVEAPHVSLLECNLTGACFEKAELSEAVLQGSRLANATFHRALASDMRLQGVQGEEADFRGCILVGSRADTQTSLDKALFNEADIRTSCWSGASLHGACFDQAKLDAVDWSKTDLSQASIQGCRMRGANLSKARLHGTRMNGSDFFQSRMRKTELVHTELRRSNLFAVDFYKAVFNSVNLEKANLKRTLIANGLP